MSWTGASSVVTAALQFVQLAVLARLLSPDDFGLMAMATVVLVLAQTLADCGLTNALIQRRDTTDGQLSSLFWVNLAAGAVLALVILATSPIVCDFFREPRLALVLIWAALQPPLAAPGHLYNALLQKDLRFRLLARVEIVSQTGGAAVAVAAALLGAGVLALVWGQLAAALLWSAQLVGGGWSSWRPSRHIRWLEVRPFVSFSLYQLGERGLNQVGRQMDKLIIGRLLGPHALGLYSVAFRLVTRPVNIINPVVNRVLFPLFASIQDDLSRLRTAHLKAVEMIAFLSFPLFLGVHVAAEPLVEFLLGNQWADAAPLLAVLAFLGLLYALGNSLGPLLLARGRADLTFWFNVVSLTVYVTAALVGSRAGLQGIAWGLILGAGLILMPLDVWMRRHVAGLPPGEYLGRLAGALLPALGMAVLLAAVQPHLPSPAAARLGLLIVLGGIAFLALSWLVRRRLLVEVLETVRMAR